MSSFPYLRKGKQLRKKPALPQAYEVLSNVIKDNFFQKQDLTFLQIFPSNTARPSGRMPTDESHPQKHGSHK